MAEPNSLPRLAARPTMYKGIRMRSRLEASVAAWLDQLRATAKFSWAYEPQCFASEAGQYLPDFRLKGIHLAPDYSSIGGRFKHALYVEVKPPSQLDDRFAIGRRMHIIRATEPRAGLMLIFYDNTPDRVSYQAWANFGGRPFRRVELCVPANRLVLRPIGTRPALGAHLRWSP